MPTTIGHQPPKKKTKKTIQPKTNTFEADGVNLNKVLLNTTKYKGKRILLDVKYLYGLHIPTGEEELLFQYQYQYQYQYPIAFVNDNNKTASIDKELALEDLVMELGTK